MFPSRSSSSNALFLATKEVFPIKRYIVATAFALLLVLVSSVTIMRAPDVLWEHALTLIGRPTRLADELETMYQDNMLGRTTLRRINLMLRTASGQREFGSIYITDDSLIPRFAPIEDAAIHKRNTHALLGFANNQSTPVAAILLPTATAILQDELPPYAAEVQFNQHGFISSVYKDFSGSIATVDVYSSLFAARDNYLYYRTDGGLTSLGGYIVYRNLANRLGLSPISEQSFRVQFLQQPYYGELYYQWGRGGVKGDSVALYHRNTPSLFTVKHWRRFESKTYYTLYPTESVADGNPMNALLGGSSPTITITNHLAGEPHNSMLILGDSNMMSVLPFIAQHYYQVTFANPDMLTDSELAAIDSTVYSQIVFGFSLDKYMNSSQPARAATAGPAVE